MSFEPSLSWLYRSPLIDIGFDALYSTGYGKKMAYDLSGIPLIGSYVQSYDNKRYMDDYMKNTGMSWDDVKYPSMVRGAGSSTSPILPTVNSLKRLYFS